MTACLFGVVLVPLVLPWTYIWQNYVKGPGDRWRKRSETRLAQRVSSR